MFPHTAEVFDNMLMSLAMIGNVFLVAMAFVLVFAVIGLYIFNGVLRGRCVVGTYPASTVYHLNMSLATPERFGDVSGSKPKAWPRLTGCRASPLKTPMGIV